MTSSKANLKQALSHHEETFRQNHGDFFTNNGLGGGGSLVTILRGFNMAEMIGIVFPIVSATGQKWQT